MSLHKLSLLYVEDDRETQTFMSKILQDSFAFIYQAYNAQEALQYYKKYKPEIILSDINLPTMSGLEMAKIIKRENPQQMILILSAFDDKKNLLDSINIGIDGFINKPVDIETLFTKFNALEKIINSKRTEEKKKEKLHSLALYDSLTKVPNRFLFQESLDKAIENANSSGSQLALFFIDLDNFKPINDTFGHQIGDKVLKLTSSKILAVIRAGDILARIGGDEFALIIENYVDKNHLCTIANKIIATVKEPLLIEGNSLAISCSIGISLFRQDTNCSNELIHFSDSAMYQAKKNGKGNYAYYQNS